MAAGFVNLQAHLRSVENHRAHARRALGCGEQGRGSRRGRRGVPGQVEAFDQLVAGRLVVASERVRKGTPLQIVVAARRGRQACSRVDDPLLDPPPFRRREQLAILPEVHRAACHHHSGLPLHHVRGPGQQLDLVGQRHLERIDRDRCLVAGLERAQRIEHDRSAPKRRRCPGDAARLGGAALRLALVHHGARGETPRASRKHPHPEAVGGALLERRHAMVLDLEELGARRHHADVRVGGTGELGGVERAVGDRVHGRHLQRPDRTADTHRSRQRPSRRLRAPPGPP